MPSSLQSQEPEPERQPFQAAGEEIARYDEAMQQQIIALAGQLQDRERATVSLEQLESAAEEAGLEPRFVREAARRLAAPRLPSPPKPPRPTAPARGATPSAPQPSRLLSHEEEFAQTIADAERAAAAAQQQEPIYVAEGILYAPLAETNLDSSPPAVPEQFRVEAAGSSGPDVILRPLPHGLEMRPTKAQVRRMEARSRKRPLWIKLLSGAGFITCMFGFSAGFVLAFLVSPLIGTGFMLAAMALATALNRLNAMYP